jgi:hypothetical protein
MQMHRLRYHSAAPTSPPTSPSSGSPSSPPPPPPGAPARRRSRTAGGPGHGTAVLLGLAIVALLAGGAVAATRSGEDAPSTAELTALSQRAALTQADFPAGWTADPADPDDADRSEERALAECLGAPYEDSPYAAETSFSSPGLSATSDFSVAPSLEWARADFATLLDVAAPSCFKKAIGRMLSPEKAAGTTYDFDVTRLDTAPLVPPAVTRDATGFRATITLHRGSLTVPMTFDAIMIRNDRIEASVGFISVGDIPFPDDLRRSLTAAVANRLAG